MAQFRLVQRRVVQRASWPSGRWVAAGWQRRLRFWIPEIAGSLILVQWLRLLGRACGAHEDHTHAYRSVIIAVYMQRT